MRCVAHKCLITLVMGVSLAGCNLAPNYVRPALPVSQSWPELDQTQYDAQSGKISQQKQTAEQLSNQTGLNNNEPNVNNAANISWQDFFLDPRLRALITIALENNRDFRIAVARMDQAQAL